MARRDRRRGMDISINGIHLGNFRIKQDRPVTDDDNDDNDDSGGNVPGWVVVLLLVAVGAILIATPFLMWNGHQNKMSVKAGAGGIVSGYSMVTTQWGNDGTASIVSRCHRNDNERCLYGRDYVKGTVSQYVDLEGNHPGPFIVTVKSKKPNKEVTCSTSFRGKEISSASGKGEVQCAVSEQAVKAVRTKNPDLI